MARKKKVVVALFITGLLICGSISIWAAERQPHMRIALQHLREARIQLEKAAPNKGGHRAKAIELVDRAIDQVEKGIQYADRH